MRRRQDRKDKQEYEKTRKRLAHEKWESEKEKWRKRSKEDNDGRDDRGRP